MLHSCEISARIYSSFSTTFSGTHFPEGALYVEKHFNSFKEECCHHCKTKAITKLVCAKVSVYSFF